MFSRVCREDTIAEGGMRLVIADAQLIVLAWPENGVIKAFQGVCPHANTPFADAVIRRDGADLPASFLVLGHESGQPTHEHAVALANYPVKVEPALSISIPRACPRRSPRRDGAAAARSRQIDRGAFEIGQGAETQRPLVRGAQHHAGRLTGREGLLPARRAQAPAVAGLEARKAEVRQRRRKIVAARLGIRTPAAPCSAPTDCPVFFACERVPSGGQCTRESCTHDSDCSFCNDLIACAGTCVGAATRPQLSARGHGHRGRGSGGTRSVPWDVRR